MKSKHKHNWKFVKETVEHGKVLGTHIMPSFIGQYGNKVESYSYNTYEIIPMLEFVCDCGAYKKVKKKEVK